MQQFQACFYATIVIFIDEMLITLAPVANISENVLPSFMAVQDKCVDFLCSVYALDRAQIYGSKIDNKFDR